MGAPHAPSVVPDLLRSLAWVLAPESGPKLDCLRNAVDSWPAALSPGRYQGPQQPGGPLPELGIGHEQLAMLPVQRAGKAGDFLAVQPRQGRGGSVAGFRFGWPGRTAGFLLAPNFRVTKLGRTAIPLTCNSSESRSGVIQYCFRPVGGLYGNRQDFPSGGTLLPAQVQVLQRFIHEPCFE
jgi:hypothetical protein